MVEHVWNNVYPEGTSLEIGSDKYKTIVDVFDYAVSTYSNKVAYHNMGVDITYAELNQRVNEFASFLQNHTNLKKGDRVAVQMPNLIQFPIAVFAIMKAGMVVVNTNPLYTAREMQHQFCDSGCKGLIALSNFGNLIEEVLPNTEIETLVLTQVGDMHKPLKRTIVNAVVKYVKKMVPDFNLPTAVPFNKALSLGKQKPFNNSHTPSETDLAVLQYTGGTTGVAKGAMLTHKNLVSNMLQIDYILREFKEGEEICITPLPMYHIFSFTVNCLAIMSRGGLNVLITNPRDIPGFVKELKKWKFSAMTGLNTLFVALMKHPEFANVDFSQFKVCIAGGMALHTSTAHEWEAVTGVRIAEGYGMTETSPVVCVNPTTAIQFGTIGIPLPGTDIKVINDEGVELGFDEPGELLVKGPQVMEGYYQKEEATKKTMSDDGEWLKTGDVAVIQPDGYVRIVDRMKDMILVSGFNVYPNEIEDVVCKHPNVVEAAAVGVPDEKSGECVKLFVVCSDDKLTQQDIIDFCRKELTGYKLPRTVVFRDELPKTNVGKILRRELRD